MACIVDDGGLSEEFPVAEEADSRGHQQALWVRVGPVYRGDGLDGYGVWVTYQEEYGASPLMGPVLLDFGTWRAVNRAVRWRMRRRSPLRARLRRGKRKGRE